MFGSNGVKGEKGAKTVLGFVSCTGGGVVEKTGCKATKFTAASCDKGIAVAAGNTACACDPATATITTKQDCDDDKTNGNQACITHIAFSSMAAGLGVGSKIRFTQQELEAEANGRFTHVTASNALYTGFEYTLGAGDFTPLCEACPYGTTIAAGHLVFAAAAKKAGALTYVAEATHGTDYSGNIMVDTPTATNAAWTTFTNTPEANYAAGAFVPYATQCGAALKCTGDDEYVKDHTCVACPAGKYNRNPNDWNDPIKNYRNIGDNLGDCKPKDCANGEYVTGNACTGCNIGRTNTFGEGASYGVNTNQKTMDSTGAVGNVLKMDSKTHDFLNGMLVEYTAVGVLFGTDRTMTLTTPTGCTITKGGFATFATAKVSTTGSGSNVAVKITATAANTFGKMQFTDVGSGYAVGDKLIITAADLNAGGSFGNIMITKCTASFSYTLTLADFTDSLLRTDATTAVPDKAHFFVRLKIETNVHKDADEFMLEDVAGTVVTLVDNSGKGAKFNHIKARTDFADQDKTKLNICRHQLCGINEKKTNTGECAPCPAGMWASDAASDDSIDESTATTCVANICAKDHSVTKGVCAPCTAGKRLSFTSDNAATKCYNKATGTVATLSVISSKATSATSTTVTFAAATPTLVVGSTITISGHTGAAAHKAMNQAYTVASETSDTVYVLTGTGMTMGPGGGTSYTAGTIVATLDDDTEAKCTAFGATHRWGTSATANSKNTACAWKPCKENQVRTARARVSLVE
jgi:hypothetical protein